MSQGLKCHHVEVGKMYRQEQGQQGPTILSWSTAVHDVD